MTAQWRVPRLLVTVVDRGDMAQVVTASRLRDGVVVFLGSGDAWVETLDSASVFDGKEAVAEALAGAQAAEAGNIVLDIYAIDVASQQGHLLPRKLREAIRARGPTVHPEFGKPGASAPSPVPEDDHVSV